MAEQRRGRATSSCASLNYVHTINWVSGAGGVYSYSCFDEIFVGGVYFSPWQGGLTGVASQGLRSGGKEHTEVPGMFV